MKWSPGTISGVLALGLSLGLFGTLDCNNNSIEGGGVGGGIGELIDLRIEPAEVSLVASYDKPAEQAFRVFGSRNNQPEDVTAQATLTLTDITLGEISKSTYRSTTSRGGTTKVRAVVGTKEVNATLTLRLQGSTKGFDGGMPLPQDPSAAFRGTQDPARAPQLVYPNDGVLLPPNLRRLEVHYRTVSDRNNLFEISFQSPVLDLRTYLRCPNPTDRGCIYELDERTYRALAETGRTGDPIRLQVRGANDANVGMGGTFGESATQTLSFSETNVEGALYYWKTSDPTAIMRFDFGDPQGKPPEVFLSPPKDGFPACIGCHTLSRDGRKMVASLGGQNDGRLVYLADLSKPSTFALKGDKDNAIQFASFDPEGSRFVAVFGDVDGPLRNRLHFHDGTTGRRIAADGIDLPFEPDHPDWSPDGKSIALTRVGIHQTSQRPFNCGIELLVRGQNGKFGAPMTLVPIAPGKSSYNPSFAPDSAFLLYSESICPNGDVRSDQCDGDADDPAKTWAITTQPGAKPILLAKVAARGVADRVPDFADTYARFSPIQQKNRGGRLFWATISSRRRAGLRDPLGKQYLWMFAVDPDKIGKGQDGGSPAFYLPFQDLSTSNHIGQWTTRVVPPLG